jgi:signal peptidase I
MLGPFLLSLFLGTPVSIVVGWVVRLLLFLVVPIDAAIVAVRSREDVHSRWNRGRVYALYAALVVVSVALLAPRLIQLSPIRLFKVPGNSMAPTIVVGDYVLARMIPPRRLPGLGDIVVIRSPVNPGDPFIKRVAGLPGQEVRIAGGLLIVDGKEATRKPTDPMSTMPETLGGHQYSVSACLGSSCDWGPLTVPPDSVFVLGDNRPGSADSRTWGFLSRENVLGMVLGVVWCGDPESGDVRWQRLGQSFR